MPYIAPLYNPDPQTKPLFPCAVDWNHPLSRGLVGCWVINEGGGLSCVNLAINIAGTFVNGTTWLSDKRLNFIGADDGIETNSVIPFNFEHSAKFSVLFDLEYTDLTTQQTIIGNLDTTASYIGWEILKVATSDGDVCPTFWLVSSFPNRIWVSANKTQTANVPYQYAITYDGSKQTSGVSFYIDAIKYDNTSTGNTLGDSCVSTKPLRIGTRTDATFGLTDGKMKFIYIWNRVLTISEITQLYIKPYCFIRPIAPEVYWKPAAAPSGGGHPIIGRYNPIIGSRIITGGR